MKVHPDYKFYITALIADKVPVTILVEYLDFVDIFFKKSAVVLLKYIEINTYTIDLEEDKQPTYEFI